MTIRVARGCSLDREGIQAGSVRWDLPIPTLYEEAVRRDEGVLAIEGPLAQARTLARMFADNFQSFAADVTPGVRAAGPTGG